jgi:hypothetical protein
VANGEILGVSLMMEDLINSLAKNKELFQVKSQAELKPVPDATQDQDQQHQKVSVEKEKSPLIVNYSKWHEFLLIWKKLELLKLHWGRRKLAIENITTPDLFAKYWYIFWCSI